MGRRVIPDRSESGTLARVGEGKRKKVREKKGGHGESWRQENGGRG